MDDDVLESRFMFPPRGEGTTESLLFREFIMPEDAVKVRNATPERDRAERKKNTYATGEVQEDGKS